jgi:hypothetical protein
MPDPNRDPAPIAPNSEPSLAIGPQWPDGHVLEGALVLEYIRDRVPEAPHDLVVAYDPGSARVVLQGTVRDQPLRERIVGIARGVPGVVSVDDRMTIDR